MHQPYNMFVEFFFAIGIRIAAYSVLHQMSTDWITLEFDVCVRTRAGNLFWKCFWLNVKCDIHWMIFHHIWMQHIEDAPSQQKSHTHTLTSHDSILFVNRVALPSKSTMYKQVGSMFNEKRIIWMENNYTYKSWLLLLLFIVPKLCCALKNCNALVWNKHEKKGKKLKIY